MSSSTTTEAMAMVTVTLSAGTSACVGLICPELSGQRICG
jgi:hypothetical protein